MWFPLQPQSLDFVGRAPNVLRFEAAVHATPEQVFDVVVHDDMGAWLPDFVDMHWTSAPPRGVGSTRTVTLKRGLAVKERFIAWERGRRLTFTMEAISLPVVRAMIEDFQLESLSARHTRVRYSVHYAPHPALVPVHALARSFFGAMFQQALRGIARVATTHPLG